MLELAINYMGKKFAPDLYNKWSNQDQDSAISRDWERESKDFDWENINYNPNALTRLQQLGIMSPDILPEEKSITDEIFTDENLMAERNDLSSIEGQQAKLKGLALAQYRVLQKKQAYEPYGGEKMTPKDKQFLNRLEEMMKEEKMYSLPLIG